MQSDTNDSMLRSMNGDSRNSQPFFGQTRIGESKPIHVEHRTPQAADPMPAPDRPRAQVPPIDPGSKLDDLIDEYKLALVYQALSQSGGNHRRAAALLGIHRSSFTRMLHRLEGSLSSRKEQPETPSNTD